MTTPPRKPPPQKKAGDQKGPRRIDGALLFDLTAAVAMFGCTEKALRAQCERGVIPYRKLGGRVVFVRRELEAFIAALPGVPLEEALANLRQRGGDSV